MESVDRSNSLVKRILRFGFATIVLIAVVGIATTMSFRRGGPDDSVRGETVPWVLVGLGATGILTSVDGRTQGEYCQIPANLLSTAVRKSWTRLDVTVRSLASPPFDAPGESCTRFTLYLDGHTYADGPLRHADTGHDVFGNAISYYLED